MKKLILLYTLTFSFLNAQVSERITLPNYYNADLGRMSCTNTLDEIQKYMESVNIDVIEADENSKLYQVKWDGNESKSIRTIFDMRIYFYDTYILINTSNYITEVKKTVKGKKVYQKLELEGETESRVNKITDDFVNSVFVKLIKTNIWK